MTQVLCEIKLAVILPVFSEIRVIVSTVQAVQAFALKNPQYYFFLGFGFDVELLYLAEKFGFSITEINGDESELHSYKQGELKLLKDSIIIFSNLFFIPWQAFPGKYD